MFPTNFSMQKRISNFWAAVFGFLYIITACLITNFYYWNFLKTINLKSTFFSIFSWPLFCKEALPDRNFTFWEWFHRILLLTQQHLSKLWQKGFVMGFISKPLAEQMLLERHSGTFLLRFSDSELGGVTIAYVRQPEQYPVRKYSFNKFLFLTEQA